jgi:hypothetical protein
MSGLDSDWQKALLGCFGDPEDVTKEGVYIHYFKALGLPENCVIECHESNSTGLVS